MKNILFAFAILILTFSCHTKKETIKQQSKITESANAVNISGKAVYNTTYCGGARPPQHIEEKHAKKRNLQNSTIIFKNIDENNISEIKIHTDKTGRFNIKLYPGIWKYYLTNDVFKQNEEIKNLLSKDCDKLLNNSFGEIIPKKDNSNLELLFHLPCNPCDSSKYPRM